MVDYSELDINLNSTVILLIWSYMKVIKKDGTHLNSTVILLIWSYMKVIKKDGTHLNSTVILLISESDDKD